MWVWAAWSEDAIWLCRRLYDSESIQHTVIQRRMIPDLRYFLRLYPTPDHTLILRSSDERVTFLETTADGQLVQQPAVVPVQLASLPCYQVKPLKDGTVAGFDPSSYHVYLWRPGTTVQAINAPDGFLIRDVDQDDAKRLWICGSAPTRRLQSVSRRPAIAVVTDDRVTWQVMERAVGGLKAAWQQLVRGEEQSYRSIATLNDYLVVSVENDDLYQRATTLYVRDPKHRWHSHTLHDDVLRSVLTAPGGGLIAITHYGQMLLIGPHGKQISLHGRLDEAIRAHVTLPADVRYEILDAQPAAHDIILVVSIRAVDGSEQARFGEAVVLLRQEADRVVAVHRENQPEVISASILSRS